jgi:hypothetical protein
MIFKKNNNKKNIQKSMQVDEAQKYFDLFVKRSYQEFINDPSDDYKTRIACLFNFHYVEILHMKELSRAKNRRDFLISLHKKYDKEILGFSLIQTAINSTKHGNAIHYPDKSIVNSSMIEGEVNYYSPSDSGGRYFFDDKKTKQYATKLGTFVKQPDKEMSVSDALQSVFQHWKVKMENYVPEGVE